MTFRGAKGDNFAANFARVRSIPILFELIRSAWRDPRIQASHFSSTSLARTLASFVLGFRLYEQFTPTQKARHAERRRIHKRTPQSRMCGRNNKEKTKPYHQATSRFIPHRSATLKPINPIRIETSCERVRHAPFDLDRCGFHCAFRNLRVEWNGARFRDPRSNRRDQGSLPIGIRCVAPTLDSRWRIF